MKVKINAAKLANALYHVAVVAVPTLVIQLGAVNGHVNRDVLISLVGGALVGAWHTVFPGGVADVKALLLQVVSFGK